MFPASQIGLDPRSSEHRRRHPHESVLPRAVKEAASTIGLAKAANCHALRHSLAKHPREDGDHLRTIQEMLGHQDVKTPMMYTRPLTCGGIEGSIVPSTISEPAGVHSGVRMVGSTMLQSNTRQAELDGDTQGC
jgi:hypothetical protein